jgi:hypothetical protein
LTRFWITPSNLVIHPLADHRNTDWWRIEINPKLSKVAGFERGTGFYINLVP